jgi:hypothetical protein
MKRPFLVGTLAATVALIISACGQSGSGAADAAKSGAAPAAAAAETDNKYAALAKLPDWSGVWEPMRTASPRNAGPPPGPPKLTEKYAPQYAKLVEKNKSTPGLNFVTDVANCVPPGLPGSMNQPYPIEFLFTPGRVTILIETYSMVRRVATDGSPMPTELDPSYQGTSVGHWEGDTLVVETAGILPETSPTQGVVGHSDQMKVTEKMRLAEPDVLEITTTVEDPTVFVEPYTSTTRYQRHRDWKIMEYVCAQNNHDFVDDKGNAGFSLERKPGE